MILNEILAVVLVVMMASCVPHVSAFSSLLQHPNHAAHASVATAVVTTSRIVPSIQKSPSSRHTTSHASSSRLFMGWGLPEPVWRDVTAVESVQDACPSGKYVYMKLAVSPEITQEYVTPGQFVQIKPSSGDTKPVFLAICSPPRPENAVLEFLIKKTDDNMWLTSPSSNSLAISQVMGNGYAIAENLDGFKYDFPTQNVILCAAGSGIAPIVSAMESGQLGIDPEKTGRTCRLYYGEPTADDLCFVEKYAEWEAAGIEVVPVLSQPEQNDEPWLGRTGYVQTALSEDGVPVPRNTGALVCGMKGMADSVKDILVSAGVFEGRILFNF
jgi:NAD(P)H-flavin reductase